jgi:hypothetical protein
LSSAFRGISQAAKIIRAEEAEHAGVQAKRRPGRPYVPGMFRTALIAAGLASAAIAAPGLAQTTPSSLHLVATQGHGGFQPKHPKPGSRFGFVQSISGDDQGTSRGVCTYLGGRPLLMCTLELDLAKGTITAQGLVPQRSHDTPIAITGGTGAYNGARGTALATDVSASKTSIDVSLLG